MITRHTGTQPVPQKSTYLSNLKEKIIKLKVDISKLFLISVFLLSSVLVAGSE